MNQSFSNTQRIRQQRKSNLFLQDLGILAFLLCMFAVAAVIAFSKESLLVQELVMFAVTCAGVLLAAYNSRYLAMAMVGAQELVYTVYVIFQHRSSGISISWSSYVWLFLPLLAVGSMLLYQSRNYKIIMNNEAIYNQMEELILIHSLTGLYNLRALYIDLERQMAYARRNNIDITLLCIELRYAQELRQLLTEDKFEKLLQTLAQCVEDAVRIEDRVYSTNDEGGFAVILSCDRAGAEVVRRRIDNTIETSKLFDQVVEQALRIDLRAAALTYDAETMANSSEFVQKTMNELQYDV